MFVDVVDSHVQANLTDLLIDEQELICVVRGFSIVTATY